MAEPQDGRHTPERPRPERYEDTADPRHPPNSVLNHDVRRTALRSYLGPLVALFIVIGAALIYWANRGPVYDDARGGAIGTAGEESNAGTVGERGNEDTPGGFNPGSRPDSTRDEVNSRGGETMDLARLTIGQRVTVTNAEVVSSQGATRFSIRSGGGTADVIAPDNRNEVGDGDHVAVTGTVESDDQGGARIRASSVETR